MVKYVPLVFLGLLLAGCTSVLEELSEKPCENHGGQQSLERKNIDTYHFTCKDGTKISWGHLSARG